MAVVGPGSCETYRRIPLALSLLLAFSFFLTDARPQRRGGQALRRWPPGLQGTSGEAPPMDELVEESRIQRDRSRPPGRVEATKVWTPAGWLSGSSGFKALGCSGVEGKAWQSWPELRGASGDGERKGRGTACLNRGGAEAVAMAAEGGEERFYGSGDWSGR